MTKKKREKKFHCCSYKNFPLPNKKNKGGIFKHLARFSTMKNPPWKKRSPFNEKKFFSILRLSRTYLEERFYGWARSFFFKDLFFTLSPSIWDFHCDLLTRAHKSDLQSRKHLTKYMRGYLTGRFRYRRGEIDNFCIFKKKSQWKKSLQEFKPQGQENELIYEWGKLRNEFFVGTQNFRSQAGLKRLCTQYGLSEKLFLLRATILTLQCS